MENEKTKKELKKRPPWYFWIKVPLVLTLWITLFFYMESDDRYNNIPHPITIFVIILSLIIGAKKPGDAYLLLSAVYASLFFSGVLGGIYKSIFFSILVCACIAAFITAIKERKSIILIMIAFIFLNPVFLNYGPSEIYKYGRYEIIFLVVTLVSAFVIGIIQIDRENREKGGPGILVATWKVLFQKLPEEYERQGRFFIKGLFIGVVALAVIMVAFAFWLVRFSFRP